MGRSHLISGVVSGLAVCALVDAPLPMVPFVVVVSAYSALAPDLDHPSAPAARVLGPVSFLLCVLVRHLSAYATGTAHRGLTHSVLYALGWGVLVGGTALTVVPVLPALWLAGAAVLGVLTHIAGDVLTVSGCKYVLWPSRVQVRVPRLVRFRTGGTAELWLVRVLMVSGVLLVPAVAS